MVFKYFCLNEYQTSGHTCEPAYLPGIVFRFPCDQKKGGIKVVLFENFLSFFVIRKNTTDKQRRAGKICLYPAVILLLTQVAGFSESRIRLYL